ncbi:MAG: HEPN domain-containing protein [Patescibacteria group bacterium]
MIEKILKAIVVKKTKIHAPYIHELDILTQKADLKLTKKRMEQLEIINTFNIRARYDIIKQQFYKQCTQNYTTKYFNIAKKLYLWLQKQYLKK